MLTVLNTVILILLSASSCFGDVDKEKPKDLDAYTRDELVLLPRLRARVKDDLSQKYMFEDKYLVRFLRASKWNMDRAVHMVQENSRWRKQYKSDDMIFQNFTKFIRRYPFYFTSALDERPTIAGALKDVNVRQIAIAGDIDKMRRYLLFAIERAVWNVHLQSNRTGKEIIGGILLFNMAGFTIRNHACAACLPLWIELAESYEKYYPQLGHTIIIINTPRMFQSLYAILKPLATGHTLSALRMYSVDKSEWEPAIRKIYAPEKLTVDFGGSAPPQTPYILTPEQIEIMLGPPLVKNAVS